MQKECTIIRATHANPFVPKIFGTPDYSFALVIDSLPLRSRTRLHVRLDSEDYLA